LNGALAQRYAAALADVALEKKNAEGVRRDLDGFAEVFHASHDLKNALESPAVSEEVKENVLGKLAARMKWDDSVRNFACLIVRHRRTEMLKEIQDAFLEDLNERLGIADAHVRTARELNAQEKRELIAALERRTGRKIEARFSLDPSVLGGAVVRVGSTIFDGSVREQLTRLRDRLESE